MTIFSTKFEGGSKYFSPFINLRVYGNWHRHATQFVPGPVRFDQNGMDFATEISSCKTPVVDEKMLILQ